MAAGDARRTTVALASAIVPGLGQLLNGRLRLAKWFALPALALAAFVGLRIATSSPAVVFASILSPTVLGVLLTLNLVVLGWRLVSVLHAFFDHRYDGRSGRAGAAGLALLLIFVVVPHVITNSLGTSAKAAFGSVFVGPGGSGPGMDAAALLGRPGANDRVNVLVVGLDRAPGRTLPRTDSLMVVSVDPLGSSVSLISLPPDIIRIPLGTGSIYEPKINTLMSYGDGHPAQFPQGGMRALEDAVGALLGIPIHYYARIDLIGFARLVDAVGGIDINVRKGFTDPTYDGMGMNLKGARGWSVTRGLHHFDGSHALAYARSRHAIGESDFTRAARQQEVLIALEAQVLSDRGLLTRLPQLMEAFGTLGQTDIPTDRLPELAAVADGLSRSSIYRLVLGRPLVMPGSDPVLGSVEVPDLALIRSAVAAIAPTPGTRPIPSTTAKPSTGPAATKAPAATP